MRKFNSLLSVTLLLVLFSCFLLTQVNSLNNLGKAWKRQMNTLSLLSDEAYEEEVPQRTLGLREIELWFDSQVPDYTYEELHTIGTKLFFLVADAKYLMEKVRLGELKKPEAHKLVGERVYHFASLFRDEDALTTRFQLKGQALMNLMEHIKNTPGSSLDEEDDYDAGMVGLTLFDVPDDLDYEHVVFLGEGIVSILYALIHNPLVFEDVLSSWYMAEMGAFLLERMANDRSHALPY